VLLWCALVVGASVVSGQAEDASTAKAEAGVEKFHFQAEVSRLMDIIIHSLYSNRDVFLRELISNAADALDKVRILTLSDDSLLDKDSAGSELQIQIKADTQANTIQITDAGIGMTKDELIRNLGTVAKSGTSEFLQKMTELQKNKAAAESGNLIGQFGVGFYSAFLVSDLVTVESRAAGSDEVWVWQSNAKGSFSVAQSSQGGTRADELLSRGTRITLTLKDDASSYAKTDKLEELVKKYSQFIDFPIYLEVEESVEAPGAEESDVFAAQPESTDSAGDNNADDADDDVLEVEEADRVENDKKAAHSTPKQKVKRMKQLNAQKPLWLREPEEVSEQEYSDFYESLDKMPGKPLAHTHFRAEGEVDFKALLYIQPRKSLNFLSMNDEDRTNNIKLFVRRVLVADKFDVGLLPAYLSFITGVVDSDDLPINVSREMLQQSRVLDIIRRKLVRKALEMIRAVMKRSDEAQAELDDKDPAPEKKLQTDYLKLWKEFGKGIKYGVLEDEPNAHRIAKLLRFRSSATNLEDDNDFTSLDKYIERMKPGQEHIYYHGGENIQQVRNSPFLEKLAARGYEVLYLTEAVDEQALERLKEYDGTKFMAASKDNFKLNDKDEKSEKDRMRSANKAFRPLKNFIKERMSDRVSIVKLSMRLTESPCVLSASQHGYSAHMELTARAQAFANPDAFAYMMPKQKIMEINPYHKVMVKLLDMVNEDPGSSEALRLLNSVYDAALVNSGYYVLDSREFSNRMLDMIAQSVDVDLSSNVTDAEIQLREERAALWDAQASGEGESEKTFSGNDGADDEGDS